MRKWKDNENQVYPTKFKKIMYIFAIMGFTYAPFHLIFFHQIIIQDILDIVGGIILIWMARFNGAYKIARWWAERELKRKDNHWKYGK